MSGDVLDVDAIQARIDAATEGPWCFYGDDLWRGTAEALAAYDANPNPDEDLWPYADGNGHLFHGDPVRPADAEFIAHARTDVPALLAALAERDAAIGRVREVVADATCAPRGHAWRYLADIERALDGAP